MTTALVLYSGPVHTASTKSTTSVICEEFAYMSPLLEGCEPEESLMKTLAPEFRGLAGVPYVPDEEYLWWPNDKREVPHFVAHCVRAEYYKALDEANDKLRMYTEAVEFNKCGASFLDHPWQRAARVETSRRLAVRAQENLTFVWRELYNKNRCDEEIIEILNIIIPSWKRDNWHAWRQKPKMNFNF